MSDPVEFLTAADAERLFGPWRRRLAESERVRRQLAEALRREIPSLHQARVDRLAPALAASDALDQGQADG